MESQVSQDIGEEVISKLNELNKILERLLDKKKNEKKL